MKHNFTEKIDTVLISVGISRKAKRWKREPWTWDELAERLSEPVRTAETYKEYLGKSREAQTEIKDVGGYVGGVFKGERRLKSQIVERTLITLDADFPCREFPDVVSKHAPYAWVLHTTHKHSTENPRYRLIIPTDRGMTPDEYAFISRRVASDIGEGYFDKTTHDVARLMYWPSAAKDGDWDYRRQEADLLGVDAFLADHPGWQDMASWRSREEVNYAEHAKKQQDPLTKDGLIGAFCRAYSIEEAMDAFIPGVYEETDQEGRYTYKGGTTSGGALVFEDKFLYSFHATDPCSEQLVNAFDLIRLHRFSAEDANTPPDMPASKRPSYKAMQEFARKDGKVKRQLLLDRKGDFSDAAEEDDGAWAEDLMYDTKGALLPRASNIQLILNHDSRVKDTVRYNDFTNRLEAAGNAPWRRNTGSGKWSDADEAGLNIWLETSYGIRKPAVVRDVLLDMKAANHYHPIRDYLNSLTWDGVKRADTLLIDFLAAEDTAYTRTVTRKMLLAAAARIYNPGAKFDNMLVLVGGQGIGKSYFIRQLGDPWSSDSVIDIKGRESFEQLQGKWIIEFGELAALKRNEVEQVKFYISKQIDTYRPAYGHSTEDFPRQCVFFGSTNTHEFLRDTTGNRRFWPVDVAGNTDRLFTEFTPSYRAQVWAEIVAAWKSGEKDLHLGKELEAEAQKSQKAHLERSEMAGLIERYLDTPLPEGWAHWSIDQRRAQFDQANDLIAEASEKRNYVCPLEIWVECFGRPIGTLTLADSREIRRILTGLPGWEACAYPRRIGPYGNQRCFKRIEN